MFFSIYFGEEFISLALRYNVKYHSAEVNHTEKGNLPSVLREDIQNHILQETLP